MKHKARSQILSLLLTAAMVFSMLPTAAYAEEAPPIGTSSVITYTLTGFAPLSEDIATQSYPLGTAQEDIALPKTLAATAVDSDGTASETAISVSAWTASPDYAADTAGIYTFTPSLTFPEGYTLGEGVSVPTAAVSLAEAAPDVMPAMLGAPAAATGISALSIGGKTYISNPAVDTDVGKAQSSGTWSWNPDTQTIVLKAQYGGAPIKISGKGSDTTVTIETEVSLTIDGKTDSAIWATSGVSLLLKGTGASPKKLTLKSSSTSYRPLDAQGLNLTLENIIIEGEQTDNRPIIRVKDIVMQEGATINVSSKGVPIQSESLVMQEGAVKLSAISATSYAMTGAVTVNGGSAYLMSGSKESSDVFDDSVTQNSGTVVYAWHTGASALAIDSITPTQGPAGGGTAVVLKGMGFGHSGATVYFGNTAVSATHSDGEKTLTVLSPAGTNGESCSIAVEVPNCGKIVKKNAYTYTAAATDQTPPVISDGAVMRTGKSTASLTFKTNEGGALLYSLVPVGSNPPAELNQWSVGTITLEGVNAAATLSFQDLTVDSYDLYLLIRDAAGNASNRLKLNVPGFVDPNAPTVTADKTTLTVAYGNDSEVIGLTTTKFDDGYSYYLKVQFLSSSNGLEFHQYNKVVDDGGSTTLNIVSNNGGIKFSTGSVVPGTYQVKVGVSKDRATYYYTQPITLTVTARTDRSLVFTPTMAEFHKGADTTVTLPVKEETWMVDNNNVKLYRDDGGSLSEIGVYINEPYDKLSGIYEAGYLKSRVLNLGFKKDKCTAASGTYTIYAVIDGAVSNAITVNIQDAGTPSKPTVSGFTATRTAVDRVLFKFTPSTGGQYGYIIQKANEAAPTNIQLSENIYKANEEHSINSLQSLLNANDVLKLYLQIQDTNTIKSEIYVLDVPAYTATNKYAITVTDGTAYPTTAAKGETVTITTNTVPSGKQFKEWQISPNVTFTGGTSKSDGTAKFTMPEAPVTATAVFEDSPATSVSGSMSIGDKRVSDLKQDDSGTGWAWTAATATLVLNNSYTGHGINIFCAATDTVQLQYSGDVTASSAYGGGLSCKGNLRINGSGGTFTITGNEGSMGLKTEGNLAIYENAKIDASGGMGGIYAQKGLTISGNANVTATGLHGVQTHDGSVTIDTTGSVSATGEGEGYAINVMISGDSDRGQLLVKNGTVTLTQTDASANLHTGELIHTGGTVNGAGSGGSTKYAITVTDGTASQTTATQGATVTLTANEAPNGKLFNMWQISPNVTFVEGFSESDATTEFTMPGEPVTATAVYEDDVIIQTGVWVGGVEVTEANKGNITGAGISGTITYDFNSKTLTLSDATISPNDELEDAIFSDDTLTVKLVGNNRLGAAPTDPSNENHYKITAGINIAGTGNVTLTGEGNLTIYDKSAGVVATNITVDMGGNLTIAEYGFGSMACCLKAMNGGTLAILRGNLTLSSQNSNALYADNSIVISGGNITAKTLGVGGLNAFNVAPTFASEYQYQVYAGTDESSATAIASPTGATYTGNQYVRIEGEKNAVTHQITVTNGTSNLSAAAKDTTVILTAGEAPFEKRFKEWQISPSVTFVDGTSKNNAVTKITMPAQAVTATAIYEDIPEGIIPVNGVTLNKDTISFTGKDTLTLVATVLPEDATNKSVTWASGNTAVATVDQNGKVTAIGNGTAVITVTTVDGGYTASCTVTVSISSGTGDGGSTGGGNGGGSGGGGTVITPDQPTIVKPDPTKPDSPTTTTTDVKADGKGNANITDSILDTAVKKAQEEAKKNGTEKNGIAVEFNITGTAAGSNLNANLPKSVLDKLAKDGVKTVTLKQNGMTLILDLAAIKEIQKANGDVTLTVSKQEVSKLSKEAQAAIGKRPVYSITMKTKDGKSITDFGKGQLSFGIPYTLAPSEKPGNLFGVYVDGNGKVEWLLNSSYDAVNKLLLLGSDHLSVYGVGYKADTADTKFTDIANHWAKSDIEFVAARGLFAGTGDGKFSPNASMTRGMFVTALGRMAQADVSKYTTSKFTDVKSGSYYLGYVEWAAANGIVKGTSDTTFAPDKAISRQEMASIMASYAKAIGFTLPKAHAEVTFADSGSIGAWAKDSVKAMQMAGVLMGKDGNKFDPQGTATRAEVSALLHRFIELAISTDTAEGWVMNDSGKWMYFENGEAVTGTKAIGGTTYQFDKYGVTADAPKDRKYSTYTVQKNDSFWLIAKKYGCSMQELASINGKTLFSILYVGDVLKVPQK